MSENRQLQEAVKQALASARKNEMTRQLDAMRRELAAPAQEQRIIRFTCAVTGRKFAAIYKRNAPGDLFRVAAIEPGPASGHGQASSATPASSEQTFALAEFDQSGWRCPWCEARAFLVNCGCGDNICQGRSRTLPNGDRYFTCHDHCRRSFTAVPATEVIAEDHKKAAARASIAAPSDRIALPKSGYRR